MIRTITAVLMLGVLASACAGGPETPDADPATQRAITQGQIIGFTREDAIDGASAHIWQGVPFAAAPRGDLRWRAPRPTPAWEGVREALAHPDPCPQVANALSAAASGVRAGDLIGSEDCLQMDIYAPAGAGPDSAALPVMVWIHGGSNVWGHASQYDGAALAAAENVVVAVVQYRLGPLGFFAHPLIEADAQTPEDAAANFALLDLIAALAWVQDNIAQFGGDASRVTIFGESAGGHNVAGLLASPLASGLFHRAIIQSGSFTSMSLEDAQSNATNNALEAASRFAGANADANAVRGADLADIYRAYGGGGPLGDLPRMIADGVSLPRDGLIGAFARADGFNAVPLITGTNRDETKLFNAFVETLTRRRLGVLFSPRDPDFYDALSDYQGRMWRVRAVDEPAATMRAGGHDAIWAYRFDWDEGGSFLTMDLSRVLGAAHAMEIPFIFNHFDFFGQIDPILFNRRNRDGREALARSMGAYWAAFARDGAPGNAGGPDWPRFEADGPLMRFDTPQDGGPALMTGADTRARIRADLAADPRLDAEQRCQIARALGFWGEEPGTEILGSLGCEGEA
jgi:para-nitrobenzyl esterase